jgi:hypothetical protein
MEPLRISRFEYAGRRYQLGTPLAVAVAYSDGLWVYSSESINLWAYADRREDALRELQENFDYLYREIAEEADESLDEVAIALKERLLALVVSPQRGTLKHD